MRECAAEPPPLDQTDARRVSHLFWTSLTHAASFVRVCMCVRAFVCVHVRVTRTTRFLPKDAWVPDPTHVSRSPTRVTHPQICGLAAGKGPGAGGRLYSLAPQVVKCSSGATSCALPLYACEPPWQTGPGLVGGPACEAKRAQSVSAPPVTRQPYTHWIQTLGPGAASL